MARTSPPTRPTTARDEAFQKEYAAAAADPAEWEAFAKRYVLVLEDEYQARIKERAAADQARRETGTGVSEADTRSA